ncbi:MAG: DNA-directed RNA polymerase subunit alpha, partial [Candidatus Limnocylindria bacterium]
RVRGVAHEFSTIPGVKEDVVEMVLNLKTIRLRSFATEPVTLVLEKEGPGDVTAADIQTTSDVEIVNTDAHIATLEPEASLWMELTVETGRGFVSGDRREGLPIGVIPIDALFGPVRKVNFTVENTRVGQVTNYDRLIFDVWTDGTTPPDEAVAQGAQVLVSQFTLFAGLTRAQPAIPPAARADGGSLPPAIADMPIEDLDLPQRAFNSLKRHGITKVGQLLQTPDEELLRMRNFGKKSLDEIKERLVFRGLIEAPEGGLQASAEGEGETEGESDVDVDELEQPGSEGELGDEPDEGNRPGDADEQVVTGRGKLEDE